jgi:hypothetical protein
LKTGRTQRSNRPIVRPASSQTLPIWWPHVWKIALLWALVLAAYSNSFDAGFVFDNESAILQARIALALCVAGIALALRLRRKNKPVCFFVLFFFIALPPTSNLFILTGALCRSASCTCPPSD